MPEKVGKRKAEYGFSRFLTKRVGRRFGLLARFAGRDRRRRAVRNARERAQIQMVLFTEMHIQK